MWWLSSLKEFLPFNFMYSCFCFIQDVLHFIVHGSSAFFFLCITVKQTFNHQWTMLQTGKRVAATNNLVCKEGYSHVNELESWRSLVNAAFIWNQIRLTLSTFGAHRGSDPHQPSYGLFKLNWTHQTTQLLACLDISGDEMKLNRVHISKE